MAEGKKSFTAYVNWKETFDVLDDETAGKLIKHLFAYVNDEHPETQDILVKASFAQIKSQLKSDLKKWRLKCEINKENGKKGGRPKTQKNRTVISKTERLISKPKKADIDIDIDIIINKLRDHWKQNAKYFYQQFNTLQPSKGHLKYLLDEFEGHVMTEDNSNKENLNDWIKHFKSWVNIKVKNGYGLN